MPDYSFTRIKKSNLAQGRRLPDKSIRISMRGISISGDVFNRPKAWVKFDVDVENSAIRVREGRENGKRSYSFNSVRNTSTGSMSAGIPKEIKKLVEDEELSKGTYKLDPDTDNVFVLV